MHPVSDRAILAFGARTKRNERVTALSQAVCNAGRLISPRWRRSGLPHCQLYAPAALRRSQRTETAVAGNRAAGFALARVPILPKMFLVEEADAGAICVLFAEQGELSYAVELRRRSPRSPTTPRRGNMSEQSPARSRFLTRSPAAACQVIPLRPGGRGARSGEANPDDSPREMCQNLARPGSRAGLATGKRLVVAMLAPLQWLRFRQEAFGLRFARWRCEGRSGRKGVLHGLTRRLGKKRLQDIHSLKF
jgi:hypothetical protein